MAGYTIKITLEHTRPPVWRRILIPDAISFSDLHKIIQTAFGWEDMHLHDFKPAGSDFGISPKEAMTAYGREFDETKLTVDDILKSSRWIRYTYDFGDDWRHKIELEKEEPDYQDRHAVIIKAKGDNFAEDCAWDESGRIVFSLLDANIALAGMSFTRKKSSEKQNMICQLLQNEKELENLYEETQRLQQRLDRLARIKEQETGGNQRKSKAEQLIRRWELFYVGYENRTEKRTENRADSPEDYEQLSLPGMEIIEEPPAARVTDDAFLLAGNYRVDTTRSEKEVRQLLLNASAGELKDYCRYIGVESSLYSGNKSKTVKAGLFTDAMRTYPEFIYYVFSKDEYKWMLKFCFSPAKAIDISGMVSCVGKMIALGFASMSFRVEDGVAVAELETAADLESILQVEKGRRLNRRYGEIEDADRFILSLLRFLGKAELEYIYESYGDYLEMFPEKADFFRFVYGYYTFPGRAFTGNDSKGRPVIVHPGLDLQEMTKLCAPYEKRLPYRVFEKWDLDAMSQGITACYPEWEIYDSLLRHDAHLPEYEANDVFGATFAGVLRGWTQDEIRKTYEEHIYGSKRKRLDDCVELWLYSMQLVMETALPMFRGYSRHELADMGWKADELALFSEIKRGKTKKETGLFELDPDIQLRLYRISQNDEADTGEYGEILKECGCENYEIRWLRVMDAMMTGEYALAESEIKVLSAEKKDKKLLEYLESVRLFREISADADDFEEELLSAGAWPALDDFGWDGFDAPQVPYRRETPKIGRNDPCPCGSGKKYKKCCGR